MDPARPISIMRVKDVLEAVNVDRKTLYRWRENGTFPRPLRLGPASIGWPRHVVDEWVANRETV